ncbi:replication initiation protein [Anaerospora hongkongensis]|uniref:replication initiation protein n=1 Tax=Anaerospora hongkongensis TaxID=244830 RepID=UPI0028A16473|nr:replication initiation protein [Anaerospora hongkongensis]
MDDELNLTEEKRLQFHKRNEIAVKRDVDPERKYPLSPAMLFANTEPRPLLGDWKVIQGVLSVIVPTDTDQYVYLIPSRSIAKAMGISPNKCQQKVKDCMNRVMDYKVSIPEPDGTLRGRWVVNFKYIDGVGDVRVRLDPDLVPYFTSIARRNAKVYAIYGGPARFTCDYTPELYSLFLWNCDVAMPFRVTVEFMRNMWRLDGKHKAISSFNQRCLFPAIDDINDFTELNVKYEPIYDGRKIVAYDFWISLKEGVDSPKREYQELETIMNDGQITLFDTEFIAIPSKDELRKTMLEKPFNMDEHIVNTLLKQYDDTRIFYAIEYVKSMKKVNHYPSYTYRSIERDYGQQWANVQFAEVKKKRAAKVRASKIEKEMREELDRQLQAINSTGGYDAFLETLATHKEAAATTTEKLVVSAKASASITKETVLEALSMLQDGPAKDKLLQSYGHLLES